jgi:hypothetical protein
MSRNTTTALNHPTRHIALHTAIPTRGDRSNLVDERSAIGSTTRHSITDSNASIVVDIMMAFE